MIVYIKKTEIYIFKLKKIQAKEAFFVAFDLKLW